MNGDAIMLITVSIIGAVIAAPYLIGAYLRWSAERNRIVDPYLSDWPEK